MSIEQAGLALQGFGAGLTGQGQQFQRNQMLKQQMGVEQDEERRKQAALRQKTLFTDAEGALGLINNGGRFDLVAQLFGNRARDLESFPEADPSDTQRMQQLAMQASNGDQEAQKALTLELEKGVSVGRAYGLLEPEERPEVIKGGDIDDQGQVAYQNPDGTITMRKAEGFKKKAPVELTPLAKEKLQGDIKRNNLANAKTKLEVEALQRESRQNPNKEDAAIVKQQKIETIKNNVGRISELSESGGARAQAVSQARYFLNAFENNGAASGATRSLASIMPGVFTDQGVFDEEFNAFAEVAARQKLKASGEIRPTDADVEGMKRAMFGVGRDEEANIELLGQFIREQESLDTELEGLISAKEKGKLSTYASKVSPSPQLVRGQTATGPNGETIMWDGSQWVPQ